MRVKHGDRWYDCEPGAPLMVELTEGDKRNIANMHPEATRYACFDDTDPRTPGEKLAWMDAPLTPPRSSLDPVAVAWRWRKVGDPLWQFDGNREWPPLTPPPGYENEPLYTHPAPPTWPQTKDIVLPRDSAGRDPDPFAFVLGLPTTNFLGIHALANLLRSSGEVDIPRKAEAETAAALHYLLGLVFKHGEAWNVAFEAARDDMKTRAAQLAREE